VINYRQNLKQLLLIILVICLGTVIDFIVHQSNIRFDVPFEYFPNKIIFGSIWAFVFLKIFSGWAGVKKPAALAILVSLGTAVVLQTKYFLQGYDLFFVGLFMFLHFIMFLIPAYFIFKKFLGTVVSTSNRPHK